MAKGDGKGRGIWLPGLKALRSEAGYSMRELEEKSGVAYSTIYRLETGEHSARSRTVRTLAEALDAPIYALTREPGQYLAEEGSDGDPDAENSAHAVGMVSKEDFAFAAVRAAAEDISEDEALGRLVREKVSLERAGRRLKPRLRSTEEMAHIEGPNNAAAAVLADRRGG